jgi:hypothetical protein
VLNGTADCAGPVVVIGDGEGGGQLGAALIVDAEVQGGGCVGRLFVSVQDDAVVVAAGILVDKGTFEAPVHGGE